MMRKYSILFSVLFALILALPAVAPALASEPAPQKSVAKYEVDFLMDMIHHHKMAVMVAEVCLEKAVHTELVELCQNIIATQSQEIEMMHEWMHDWYGMHHHNHKSAGMMKQVEKLSQLEGADFEIVFMNVMIKHHRMAVMEAEKCTQRAYHAELISLCEDIIVTQTQEIMLMQDWLCEWYAICKDDE